MPNKVHVMSRPRATILNMAPYQTLAILPELAFYVKSIEIQKMDSNSFSSPLPHDVLPGLSVVMGFQYQASLYRLENGEKKRLARCGVSGLQTQRRVFQPENSNTKTILVKLYPWVTNALFKEDAYQFTNEAIALSEIVSQSRISCLEEQLASTTEVEELSLLVQGFLLDLLKVNKSKMPDNSIISFAQQLSRVDGVGSIAKLAQEYGLGTRSLERNFKSIIGMSPKKFLRLSQFQKTLFHLQSGAGWEEIVDCLNYYDQAHFINSFKDFSGITPGEFKVSNI